MKKQQNEGILLRGGWASSFWPQSCLIFCSWRRFLAVRSFEGLVLITLRMRTVLCFRPVMVKIDTSMTASKKWFRSLQWTPLREGYFNAEHAPVVWGHWA